VRAAASTPRGLTVEVANAGHPPALVQRAGGRVEQVTAGRAPLVGILADVRFAEAELELDAGELLLLVHRRR